MPAGPEPTIATSTTSASRPAAAPARHALDHPRALRDRVAHERHAAHLARQEEPGGVGLVPLVHLRHVRARLEVAQADLDGADRAGLLAARVADAAHAVDDGGGAADDAQHVALRAGGDARAAADAAQRDRCTGTARSGGRRRAPPPPACARGRGAAGGGRRSRRARRSRPPRAAATVQTIAASVIALRSGRPLPRTRACPRSRRPASTRRPRAGTTGAGAARSPTRGCAGPAGRRSSRCRS